MRIRITLHSDLCVSAGKGYSCTIDNDACYDDFGLPYIPSRRIKGCLREAAEFIGLSHTEIDEIFGKTGAGITDSGKLTISDARLEFCDAMRNEITDRSIAPEVISELFSDVRASTALKDGVADDTTLRFVRVVCKDSPLKKDGSLEFFSEITFLGSSSQLELLEKCCRATRNIGYKRNRGLGAVSCSLEKQDSSSPSISIEMPKRFELDKKYVIRYTVLLESDIAVGGIGNGYTEDYIPGTAVLGAVAAKHLQQQNAKEDFNRVFFDGEVKFGNLTVCDEYGEKSEFAPFSLAKCKETGEIVNILSDIQTDGKNIKPLKSGYITKYQYFAPDTKTVFHHSRSGEKLLYTQECIASGQYFSGIITARGEYAKLIIDLLSDGRINLGRSRSAQYSHCRITAMSCDEASEYKITLLPGNKYALILRADMIPATDGLCLNDAAILFRSVFQGSASFTLHRAFIKSKVTEGYNAKWNLKKPHEIAVNAGSVFVFSVSTEVEYNSIFSVGERLSEGFGVCEIVPDADRAFEFQEADVNPETVSSIPEKEKKAVSDMLDFALERNYAASLVKEHAVAAASAVEPYEIPDTAQIGRVMLMAKEALRAESWCNFLERVNSIKSDSTSAQVNQLIKIFLSDNIDDLPNETDRLCSMVQFLTLLKYRKKVEKGITADRRQKT